MPVYDELYKFKDELQHVLVRHEQGQHMLHKDMQEQPEK
jgi:thiamine pyrophosphate-dependent acetolactate synthase large subunit-like protein